MTQYDLYSLILCLVVFVLLAGSSILLLSIITKQGLKLVTVGAKDEELLTEYKKSLNKKKSKCMLDKIFAGLVLLIFLFAFAVSIYFAATQNTYSDKIPNVKVVRSASMQTKNKKNTYLFTNNLNNQFSTFDILFTYKMPKEEDLKLYDIVIYEVDGIAVIHRIVAIEEPNARHPNERWFMCQGDAVESPDRFPVRYEQMRGIYRGERVPFIGSFILFMQSPAGWICLILLIAAVIATPIIERKIANCRKARLDIILESLAVELAPTQEEPEEDTPDWKLRLAGKKSKQLTFAEKLEINEQAKGYYTTIEQTVENLNYCRVIDGKTRTFKFGNTPIVKFAIKGKTLNAYVALNPKDYENTKYYFTDVSETKKFANYPMRVKVTSDRQVKWTIELIQTIMANPKIQKGIAKIIRLLAQQQAPVEETTENTIPDWKLRLAGKKSKQLTFAQKLEINKKANDYYNEIIEKINAIKPCRIIDGKTRTVKFKNVPVVKFAIKGKTLNAYVALNPQDYLNTKYYFTDVSEIKKFANYPMRVKVTSDRQVKWTIELIEKIFE